MAAGRGANRKEVLWGPRDSASGQTFASDIRPWDASFAGWRALNIDSARNCKDTVRKMESINTDSARKKDTNLSGVGVVKPSANRKCRKSNEVKMWPYVSRALGFSSRISFPGSPDLSALGEAARLPGAGKSAGCSRACWNGGRALALRRPNRSRAFAPGLPPSLPRPGWVASPRGEELDQHEARRARVGDATLEVVVSEFQHVGGRSETGRGEKQRHAGEQRSAAGAHGYEVRLGAAGRVGARRGLRRPAATTHPVPALARLAQADLQPEVPTPQPGSGRSVAAADWLWGACVGRAGPAGNRRVAGARGGAEAAGARASRAGRGPGPEAGAEAVPACEPEPRDRVRWSGAGRTGAEWGGAELEMGRRGAGSRPWAHLSWGELSSGGARAEAEAETETWRRGWVGGREPWLRWGPEAGIERWRLHLRGHSWDRTCFPNARLLQFVQFLLVCLLGAALSRPTAPPPPHCTAQLPQVQVLLRFPLCPALGYLPCGHTSESAWPLSLLCNVSLTTLCSFCFRKPWVLVQCVWLL